VDISAILVRLPVTLTGAGWTGGLWNGSSITFLSEAVSFRQEILKQAPPVRMDPAPEPDQARNNKHHAVVPGVDSGATVGAVSDHETFC